MYEKLIERAGLELSGPAFMVILLLWFHPDKGPDGKPKGATVQGTKLLAEYSAGMVRWIFRELELKGWVRLIYQDDFGRNQRWVVVAIEEVPELPR